MVTPFSKYVKWRLVVKMWLGQGYGIFKISHFEICGDYSVRSGLNSFQNLLSRDMWW